MKTKQGIIISSVDLRLAFVEASKVKPSKDIPITENYLIECEKNKCWLVRTNLEDTIKIEWNFEWNFDPKTDYCWLPFHNTNLKIEHKKRGLLIHNSRFFIFDSSN